MSASLAKRQRVIDFALQQAYEGAHYLWGSLGTTPNYGAEVTFYPKSLNPKTVSFCAAQCSRNSGLQICGGRFAQKALAAVWKGPPGSSKGVAVSASDPALAKWISDNGHYAMTDWDDTLTPRVTKGVGVTEQIVWGEGCDGTRHFDCISFINWCLKKVSPKWQTADIPHFFYSIEPRGAAVQTREVTDDDDVMPADILLYGKVVKPAADYFRERVADEREQGKDDAADADQAAYNKGETVGGLPQGLPHSGGSEIWRRRRPAPHRLCDRQRQSARPCLGQRERRDHRYLARAGQARQASGYVVRVTKARAAAGHRGGDARGFPVARGTYGETAGPCRRAVISSDDRRRGPRRQARAPDGKHRQQLFLAADKPNGRQSRYPGTVWALGFCVLPRR